MNREEDKIVILGHLKNWWNPTKYGPIAWPNAVFSTPKNGQWATTEILEYDTFRASLSNDFLLRHLGALQIDLYTPEGQGTGKNRAAADDIFREFMELILPAPSGAIYFGIPVARSAAANELRAMNLEDNWSRYTVTIPYKKDSLVVK